MNPNTVVSVLLDDLPGVDQQTLDQIMGIIFSIVDKTKTGNPGVDRQRFEQEVNPLLEPWGIKFTSNDTDLQRYNVPGKAGIEGVALATPKRINRGEFAYLREILSHELVHGDQITRAMMTGNAAKMFKSAHDRMMPGGVMDYEKYLTDPHEVTAYARSAVDKMRRQNIGREQAMQILRTEPVSQHQPGTKSHKRFMKHAAGYAQQLPESRSVLEAAIGWVELLLPEYWKAFLPGGHGWKEYKRWVTLEDKFYFLTGWAALVHSMNTSPIWVPPYKWTIKMPCGYGLGGEGNVANTVIDKHEASPNRTPIDNPGMSARENAMWRKGL